MVKENEVNADKLEELKKELIRDLDVESFNFHKNIPNLQMILKKIDDSYELGKKELKVKHENFIKDHKDLVNRCALLRQRHDLPVDRIPAYNSLLELQDSRIYYEKKIERLQEKLKTLPSEEEIEEFLKSMLMHNFMGDMRLRDYEFSGEESIKFLAKAILKRIGE